MILIFLTMMVVIIVIILSSSIVFLHACNVPFFEPQTGLLLCCAR